MSPPGHCQAYVINKASQKLFWISYRQALTDFHNSLCADGVYLLLFIIIYLF